MQDYQSVYLDLYADLRQVKEADKETINDDLVFEIELIKQVEVNVDYILLLVRRYLDAKGTPADKEIKASISRAIDSSPTLRNQRDLIEEFVDRVSATASVDEEWQRFVAAKRADDLRQIIAEEGLRPEETEAFVGEAFRDGAIPMTGTAITRILPAVSRFGASGGHALKKQSALAKLTAFFDRYFGLS